MKQTLSLLICTLTAVISLSSLADPHRKGEWSGSGGDGQAYIFTSIGYRLHREFLMEPYQKNKKQVRDEMSMPHFLGAIDNTKVITTDERITDKHGHEQTAVYYTPDELRTLYKRQKKSEAEIEKILKDFPGGLIVVQEDRFRRELAGNGVVAMATVFHEYRRVLGFDEDNYRSSASQYDIAFFERLKKDANPVTQTVMQEASNNIKIAVNKMERIDHEKLRIERELEEDFVELQQVRIKRRPFVDAARKSYSKMMNAYADVLETIGFVVMPFPSANSDTVSAIGIAGSASMDLDQKLDELEVINLQSQFLEGNIRRNMAFYEKIDLLRQQIFIDSLN